MKYIVEVREPVPSNLDEIAGKVAASFHIGDDKALALLKRAPGAMTKAVSEREADVVAGIFERAGLVVVKRPAEAPVAPPAEPVAEDTADAVEPSPYEPVSAEPAEEAGAHDEANVASDAVGSGEPDWGEPSSGAVRADVATGAEDVDLGGFTHDEVVQPGPVGHDEDRSDVWDRPLEPSSGDAGAIDSFSRRDGFEANGGELEVEAAGATAEVEPDLVEGPGHAGEGALEVDDDVTDAGAPVASAAEDGVAQAEAPAPAPPVGRSASTPETARRSQTPEMLRRSQTPETLRSTLTRSPGDTALKGAGLRRRVANAAILPALLTLVVMGVAMLVTLMPLLRSQQAARAAGAAHAEAATLEALTGGMPLTAQTLQAPLTDLARRSQSVLGGTGVQTMIVTDATGAPVAGWYGPATTPAALPPDARGAISTRALDVVAGRTAASESFTESLVATWHGVLAMVGLGTVPDVYAAAPVMSAGRAAGAVVVGVEPAGASSLAKTAFLTTLLVGLVPVLVAILVAMGLTRGLRAQVSYLLEAADRISRGDLEEAVELDSHDELGQLARAIERMRVSLQEGMERLRRRR